jgi:hypothetical protein
MRQRRAHNSKTMLVSVLFYPVFSIHVHASCCRFPSDNAIRKGRIAAKLLCSITEKKHIWCHPLIWNISLNRGQFMHSDSEMHTWHASDSENSTRPSRAHNRDSDHYHRTGTIWSETRGFKYPHGRTATPRDPCSNSNPPLRGTRAAVTASTAPASLALSVSSSHPPLKSFFFERTILPWNLLISPFHSVSFSRPVGSVGPVHLACDSAQGWADPFLLRCSNHLDRFASMQCWLVWYILRFC